MAKARDDLDADLDALYAAPPAEFVAARNALAKKLEGSGRKAAAARVKALKKPNAAAWAVNQLAFSAPRLLAALVASGDRLRARPSDAKEALRERRESVREARQEVERTLAGAGHAAGPDVLRRVSATLEAIATYGSAAGGPVAGRLTEDAPPPGFDEIASLGLVRGTAGRAPATALRTGPQEGSSRRAGPSGKPSKHDAARERALEKKRRRAMKEALTARVKEALRAREGLRAVEKAASAIRRRKASLEAALAEATAEERKLDTALAEARRKSDAADAAEEDARRSTRET